MSRKKTDKVIEHRITFGDLERRELKQTLDAYQRQQKIKNFSETGRIVLVGGAVVGVGYLGIITWRAINELLEWDWWRTTKDAVSSAAEGVASAAVTVADVVLEPVVPIVSTGVDVWNVTVPESLQVDPTFVSQIEDKGLLTTAGESIIATGQKWFTSSLSNPEGTPWGYFF